MAKVGVLEYARGCPGGRKRHISFIEKEPQDGEHRTRIAVVRCDIVAEVCPGVACFRAFHERHHILLNMEIILK